MLFEASDIIGKSIQSLKGIEMGENPYIIDKRKSLEDKTKYVYTFRCQRCGQPFELLNDAGLCDGCKVEIRKKIWDREKLKDKKKKRSK